MKYGTVSSPLFEHTLNKCVCGCSPIIMWRFMKGTANHVNYHIRCLDCKTKTRNRKRIYGAIEDWNDGIFLEDKRTILS